MLSETSSICGMNFLHIACSPWFVTRKRLATVTHLLNIGEDIKTKTCVSLFVSCTINLNIMYCYSHIFTKINEESCLFMAIELDCSEYDIITLLLRKGADIDEKRKVILSLLCVPSLI